MNKYESKALRLLKPGLTQTRKQDIKAYSKMYSEDLIDILFRIAQDEENFPRDRIQAAEAVLNRAYGKPRNEKDDDDLVDALNVERLTTSQLTKMLSELNVEEGIVETVNPQEQLLLEAAEIKNE